MPSPNDTPTDDLAALAGQAAALPTQGAAAAPGAPDQAAQDAEDEAQLQQLRGVVEKLVFGGLRALRAVIARRVPEILDEWPDQALRDPAANAFPLLHKRLGALTEVAGKYPEEAAFVLAVVPLGLGAMAAIEKHEANQAKLLQPGADGVHVPAEGQQ